MTVRYTLHIANKRYSSWSLRPWLVLRMAGIPFEETVTSLYTPETAERIRPLSPSGRLPVLTIEEASRRLTVWDSLAICETLAERHAESRLWPADPAARGEARSLAAEMHSGFADLRRVLPMDVTRRLPAPELDDAVRAQIARLTAIWTHAGENDGFLFGAFCIADAFYAPVATRFETYGVALPEAAGAYAKRLLGLAPLRAWRDAAMKEPDPKA